MYFNPVFLQKKIMELIFTTGVRWEIKSHTDWNVCNFFLDFSFILTFTEYRN